MSKILSISDKLIKKPKNNYQKIDNETRCTIIQLVEQEYKSCKEVF